MGGVEEPEQLPYGLGQIEAIADRLHSLLLELQDVNRANYPPGPWDPGPLQWRFMEAIDGLMEAELPFLQAVQAVQAIKAEQRRRLHLT